MEDPLNSSPAPSLWDTPPTPLHFSVIHRLAKLRTPFIKTLNIAGLSIYPWGMPLVTEHQLNFVTLMNTLWVWWFSQFSIHLIVHLSRQKIIALAIGTLWKTTALLKSRYTMSTVSLVHRAIHLIAECNKVSQESYMPSLNPCQLFTIILSFR